MIRFTEDMKSNKQVYEKQAQRKVYGKVQHNGKVYDVTDKDGTRLFVEGIGWRDQKDLNLI